MRKIVLWHAEMCAYVCVYKRSCTFERNRCIILTRLVNGTSAEMKTASHVGRPDTREKRSTKIIKSACHFARTGHKGTLSIIDADDGRRGINAF